MMKKIQFLTTTLLITLQCFGQIGINTEYPENTLDINGGLSVRQLESTEGVNNKEFYDLKADEDGVFYKASKEPSSYSKYLGFDPMAPTHEFVLPLTLEDGYLTTIEGVGIIACYGAPISFTLNFKGNKLLGGKMIRNAVESVKSVDYTIIPSDLERMQSTPIDNLDGDRGCSNSNGIFFKIDTNTRKINVKFSDIPAYFQDAGTIAITNTVKVKYK